MQDAVSLMGAMPAGKFTPQIRQTNGAPSNQLRPAIGVRIEFVVVVVVAFAAIDGWGLCWRVAALVFLLDFHLYKHATKQKNKNSIHSEKKNTHTHKKLHTKCFSRFYTHLIDVLLIGDDLAFRLLLLGFTLQQQLFDMGLFLAQNVLQNASYLYKKTFLFNST